MLERERERERERDFLCGSDFCGGWRGMGRSGEVDIGRKGGIGVEKGVDESKVGRVIG